MKSEGYQKSQKVFSKSGSSEIHMRLTGESQTKAGNLLKKNEKILAYVLKSVLSGEKAEFRIMGKAWTANTFLRLFESEILEMDSQDLLDSQWKIHRREYTKELRNHPKQQNPFLPFNESSKNAFHRRDSIDSLIHSVFQKSQGNELSDKQILKILDQFFPFLNWASNPEFFSWNWGEMRAKSYFSSSKDSKRFLVVYNSRILGIAKFLFDFDKKGNTWRLYSSFEKMEFYESFIEWSPGILEELENLGIPPLSFHAEYRTEKYLDQSRGWTV